MFTGASRIKSLEIFAGAGGLALGAARAGFRHVAVIDSDNASCRTLRRNKADGVEHALNWKIVESDTRFYDFEKYAGHVHLVSGGPPCQPFSSGGKRLGHADKRDMFPHAIRAVREIRPMGFLFENVKGLIRPSFSRYYEYIILQLRFPGVSQRDGENWTDHYRRLEQLCAATSNSELMYNVAYKCLNAADYGVPQRRERVFVVGTRADLGLEFNFPQGSHSREALLRDQWVTGHYWERHEIPKSKRPNGPPNRLKRRIEKLSLGVFDELGSPWRTVRDAIRDLPRVGIGQTSKKASNHFLNPGARAYPGHDGSRWDEPAKTIKAGDHGVPGGENTLRYDGLSVRYFSVRECARLQTFPDNWYFEGSWTNSMRQLGNAVPVDLANAVASKLFAALAG